MRRPIRKAAYIVIGIFAVFEMAWQWSLLQDDLLSQNQPADLPYPGSMEPSTGMPGSPKLWVKETNDWRPGSQVSKTSQFAGFNDPLSAYSVVINRRRGRRRSLGTAFAVASNGLWLTARHLVSGCREVFVQAGLVNGHPRAVKANDIQLHPSADVAAMATGKTDFGRTPLHLSRAGIAAQKSFHVGFPGGSPGAVHGILLGRKQVRHRGVRGSKEGVLVWAEVSRVPAHANRLNGISGGVAVDRTGAVIGTNSAISPRRGRIMTSRPRVLHDILRLSGNGIAAARPPARRGYRINANNYMIFAKNLIQNSQVVRVNCLRR